MNLPFFIARKYFLSGKKKNFINVIAIISMIVVAIGTMSLIIALSVFNGLEGLLRTMYGNFDPDIIVTPASGKSFVSSREQILAIQSLVSTAVPDLKIANVSIIDSDGNLLAKGEEESANMLSMKAEEMRRAYERRLTEKIEDQVSRIVGFGLLSVWG